MNPALLYLAAALTGLWGAAHLFATKGVVKGFGELKPDNKRIITMEWIVEGVALISIAAFVIAAAAATPTGPASSVSSAIYAVAIGALLILAIVSLFTGFRVAFLPFRLCPIIFAVSALLIAWGAWF